MLKQSIKPVPETRDTLRMKYTPNFKPYTPVYTPTEKQKTSQYVGVPQSYKARLPQITNVLNEVKRQVLPQPQFDQLSKEQPLNFGVNRQNYGFQSTGQNTNPLDINTQGFISANQQIQAIPTRTQTYGQGMVKNETRQPWDMQPTEDTFTKPI